MRDTIQMDHTARRISEGYSIDDTTIAQDEQNRNKLNILMITPFFRPNIGGVETHLDDLCRYLQAKGHSIFVITYQPLTTKSKGSAMERQTNIEIRRITWFGYNLFNKLENYPLLEFLYLALPLYLKTLWFMIRNGKSINVIHTHGLIAALVGRLIGVVFKRRMVCTIHTIYYLHKKPLLRRIFSWILEAYDKVLFVSKGIKCEFMAYGLDPNKTKVFTYWADKSRFKSQEKQVCKHIVGWEGKFVCLFVGRLIREKGLDVLVEVARKTGKDIFFAVITSGKYEEFLRMIGEGLPKNIIYVGPVEYSKLNVYYSAADVLIVPSQVREGFARVVIEAALCGTPVIASKIGCLPEVVNSEIGELIDPPTADQFARRIEYYFYKRDTLAILSESCNKYALVNFTEDEASIVEQSYFET